jgi:hypothetical protein
MRVINDDIGEEVYAHFQATDTTSVNYPKLRSISFSHGIRRSNLTRTEYWKDTAKTYSLGSPWSDETRPFENFIYIVD